MAALVLDVHHAGLFVGGAEASLVPLEGVVGVLAALRELAGPAVNVDLYSCLHFAGLTLES